MNINGIAHVLERRAAIACRQAHLQGESLENPYLPGSDQWQGWEQERHRIEVMEEAA